MGDPTVFVPGGRKFIGKYRIDDILGQGAMGVVYAGHDPDIDRAVAIKTVHAHLIDADGRGDWLDRFAREARAAGRVLHPNLVTVFDYLQQDDIPYLVMERVSSITLEDRMSAIPRLELDEVHSILSQILKGLACIHNAGIVHRDMKPANVMLTDDGTVKLTDFGIARIQAMDATGAGMIGTPSYMAPEQFAGGAVDARADIYACGVLLYELVTGRKPFKEGGIEALFTAVRNGSMTPPSEIAPNLSPMLDQVVAKALSLEPEGRFDDAAALRSALAQALPAEDQAALAEMTQISRPRDVAPPAASTTMLQMLPQQTLTEVERELVSKIGPMGKVITRRAAARCSNIDDLIEQVLSEITGAHEQKELRESMLRLLSSFSVPANTAIPEDQLQKLARLLKPHMGPVSTVLVKRLSARAASLEQLIRNVSEEIKDPGEREIFRAAAEDVLG